MKILTYEKYNYLKQSLINYIVTNNLQDLSNNELLKNTNLFNSRESIRYFRVKGYTTTKAVDSIIFSRYDDNVLCSNKLGDKMWIDNREYFSKFMNKTNEKFIKQGKIYGISRPR